MIALLFLGLDLGASTGAGDGAICFGCGLVCRDGGGGAGAGASGEEERVIVSVCLAGAGFVGG